MTTVRAAVVEAFDRPPRCTTVPAPVPRDGEELVDVLAVGIHPVTRGVAAGRHYAAPPAPPFVAGTDAVVRRQDGSLAVLAVPGAGTLAERLAVDPRTLVPVPDDAPPEVVAASINPALSSWVALTARVGFRPGQSLLVIGATGNAGSAAVKVGAALGASRVVAAGRDRASLERLRDAGADGLVVITSDPDETAAAYAAAAADVDVVLDYVWGPGTALAMEAITSARTDRARPLDWVQIGTVGGADVPLAGHVLRRTALRVSGSGMGSVDPAAADLPGLARLVATGAVTVTPRVVPLEDVCAAWAHQDARGERTVVVL